MKNVQDLLSRISTSGSSEAKTLAEFIEDVLASADEATSNPIDQLYMLKSSLGEMGDWLQAIKDTVEADFSQLSDYIHSEYIEQAKSAGFKRVMVFPRDSGRQPLFEHKAMCIDAAHIRLQIYEGVRVYDLYNSTIAVFPKYSDVDPIGVDANEIAL